MSITFEEVTADVEREPQRESGVAPPAQAARGDDLHDQLDRELRLRDERRARRSAD